MSIHDLIRELDASVSIERTATKDRSQSLPWEAGVSLTIKGVFLASDMTPGSSCDDAIMNAWTIISPAVKALRA